MYVCGHPALVVHAVHDLFQMYKSQQGFIDSVQFHQRYLSCLNSLLYVSLEKAKVTEVTESLWR
jgi:hypothetical protein